MARTGRRRRDFGDADVAAQYRADRERDACRQLYVEQLYKDGTADLVRDTCEVAVDRQWLGSDRTADQLILPGRPIKMTPFYGVTGGSLILNGTGGSLGSGILAPRKP